MTRAAGRHRGGNGARPAEVPEVDPNSPEGQGLGMSERMQGYPSPIPGGAVHVVNSATVRHPVPTPDSPPEVKPINAHGVPPGTSTSRDRADMQRGPNTHHHSRPPQPEPPPQPRPEPVPVFVVEGGEQSKAYRSAAPRHLTLQASTGDAVRLCGRNPLRTRIGILNESTSSDIRFAHRISDLTGGGGALLPWPGNSYLWLHTQDELYAISKDSGTPVISIIEEYEQPW